MGKFFDDLMESVQQMDKMLQTERSHSQELANNALEDKRINDEMLEHGARKADIPQNQTSLKTAPSSSPAHQ